MISIVHYIENNQITTEVLKTEKLVIMDFFATWCMPCQMLSSVLDSISKKYSNDVEIFKVNVDDNQETAIRYNVSSVPTIIFFKNGEEIERQVGFIEEDSFSNIIEELK